MADKYRSMGDLSAMPNGDSGDNSDFSDRSSSDGMRSRVTKTRSEDTTDSGRGGIEGTATGDDQTERVTKRRCAVCTGLATGYHYGVASCEACKAFFKRTVQRKLAYTCVEKRQCAIVYGKRRTCQACRYEKCIQVGMLITGVRLNRNKGGRQEYRRRPEERDFSPATTGKKRKHRLALEFSERLMEIDPDILTIEIPDEIKQSFKTKYGSRTSQRLAMKMMSEITGRALITTVRWAKKVPGFDKLCMNDQMALLCNSWLEILLLNVVYQNCLLPVPEDGRSSGIVIFADCLVVYKEDMCSPGHSISPLIFAQISNVVDRLRPLQLSKSIVVILKAMVLFNAGPSLVNRIPLQSHKELQEIQSTVHDALHYRIQQEYPGNSRLVYHLMMLLPLIKDTALTISSVVWSEFSREEVPMQDLLREMLQPVLQGSGRNVPQNPTAQSGNTDIKEETPG